MLKYTDALGNAMRYIYQYNASSSGEIRTIIDPLGNYTSRTTARKAT